MSQRLAPWPMFNSGGARRSEEESGAPTRPKLKVLEGGNSPRLERLTPRHRLIALISMVAVVLFGVVSFHVLLSQGQYNLEKMQAQADQQQDQYERLRLQVAQLESPARITSEAQNRLGMVIPERVTPVVPKPEDITPGSQTTARTSDDSGPGSLDTWSGVKPYLASPTQ